MSQLGLDIPTKLTDPRCFVLEPVINKSTAFSQAGEHKSKVFGSGLKRAISSLGKKNEEQIEIKLIQRRFVPFWLVRCRSHFDYSRHQEYSITAHDKESKYIALQGCDLEGQSQEIICRVDQAGKPVKLTGIERCVKDRELEELIDPFSNTEKFSQSELDNRQKQLRELAMQNSRQVPDLESFVKNVTLDGKLLFDDDLETIVVPPLEPADTVAKQVLRKVMVPVEAARIYDWLLEVDILDLFFRPIYVFEFIRMDKEGKPVERKLEELDALKKDRWVTLESTDFQMPTVPWMKILKLSTDIGVLVLKEVPVVGTTMEVLTVVAKQGPEIVSEIKKGSQ